MLLRTQAMPGLRVKSFIEVLSCSEQAQHNMLLRKDAVLAMLQLQAGSAAAQTVK